MDIVQSNEAFKLVDNKLQFQYVAGFIRIENDLYFAKWTDRKQLPLSRSELYDVRQIITEDRGPQMQLNWLVAEGQDCYIKTPSLYMYTDANFDKLLLREIEMCEFLRQHPHPNLALYLGCREIRGRVSSLCFKKYAQTLADAVDPRHLNKAEFLSGGRSSVSHNMKQSLIGLKEAINHLHSLNIIHNDITPANVMFDEDGAMVLIDFDSCRWVGEELRGADGSGTKRTHGWHDPDITISLRKNDLDAFAELETWLFGASVNDFIFCT